MALRSCNRIHSGATPLSYFDDRSPLNRPSVLPGLGAGTAAELADAAARLRRLVCCLHVGACWSQALVCRPGLLKACRRAATGDGGNCLLHLVLWGAMVPTGLPQCHRHLVCAGHRHAGLLLLLLLLPGSLAAPEVLCMKRPPQLSTPLLPGQSRLRPLLVCHGSSLLLTAGKVLRCCDVDAKLRSTPVW